MYAAALGYTEIVLLLIEAGADVNLQTNSGLGASTYAYMCFQTEIGEWLESLEAVE